MNGATERVGEGKGNEKKRMKRRKPLERERERRWEVRSGKRRMVEKNILLLIVLTNYRKINYNKILR